MPMKPKEILEYAEKHHLKPGHLHGLTQHKTLHARLSEHILERGSRSILYRTGPGMFFLRELQDAVGIDEDWKTEWYAPRRKKALTQESVLTIPTNLLTKHGVSGIVQDTQGVLNLLHHKECRFTDRVLAESDDTLKQVVTYVVITKNRHVLSYRRGTYNSAEEEIRGARSIGFGGHVTISDADMLDNETKGIKNNAARELMEELHFKPDEERNLQNARSLKLMGFINVNDTEEARKHMAAVILYRCLNTFEPVKGELSINELSWFHMDSRPNHLNDFELWSRILIEGLMAPMDQDTLPILKHAVL